MIGGRTPSAAARALREVLQRAVSCVSLGVLVEGRRGIANELVLNSRVARLSLGAPITLIIQHRYGLLHDASVDARTSWRAQTTEYFYTLEDADGREILGYHWHPVGRSPVTTPHLHLGAGAGGVRPELTKAHLETGLITPATVLALLLDEFAIRPRRADWRAILGHARIALAPA